MASYFTAHSLVSAARKLLFTLGAVLALGAHAGYPDKPIKLINPFSAGGTSDSIARLLAQRLSESLSQTVVVENKVGANGSIGAVHVASSAPDGYTLMLATPAFSTYNAFNRESRFDPLRDFTAIGLIGDTPMVLAVPSSAPHQNASQFIAAARQSAAPYAYGSTGRGSSYHIFTESFNEIARIASTEVPYKGDPQLTADLVGGQIQYAIMNGTGAQALARAGKLKVLASASVRRLPTLPDVPTLAEQGIDLVAASRFFLVAPAGTPSDIVERLNRTLCDILSSDTFTQRVQELGLEPKATSLQEAQALVRREVQRASQIASKF
jgi:tripartite-type tricarboxylate transporter receptor subunit TctC